MFEEFNKAFGAVLDAVPRNKKPIVFQDASFVEMSYKNMASCLNQLRQYFIDNTGEESPFVKKIDELLPRSEEK